MADEIVRYDNQKIIDVEINKEVRNAFLDYSMSVIVQRALPDVRDGLKPVHRRILYTMFENNLYPRKRHTENAPTPSVPYWAAIIRTVTLPFTTLWLDLRKPFRCATFLLTATATSAQ